MAFDRDQVNVAAIVVLVPIGFRGARIVGTWRDVQLSVPIAEGQIAQASVLGALGRDEIARFRLVGQPPRDAAVRQTDAGDALRGWGAIEPFGLVDRLAMPAQGGRQHGNAIAPKEDRRGLIGDDHIIRQAHLAHPGPNAVGQGSIVVARQKHPGAREGLQGFEGLEDGAVMHLVAVEGITRDQHGIDALGARQFGDLGHRSDPLGSQFGTRVARNVAEGLADLPIRRVDEAETHVVLNLCFGARTAPQGTLAAVARRIMAHCATRDGNPLLLGE